MAYIIFENDIMCIIAEGHTIAGVNCCTSSAFILIIDKSNAAVVKHNNISGVDGTAILGFVAEKADIRGIACFTIRNIINVKSNIVAEDDCAIVFVRVHKIREVFIRNLIRSYFCKSRGGHTSCHDGSSQKTRKM